MSGETNLSTLIGAMTPRLHDDVFVFATIAEDGAAADIDAVMRFGEREGTTLVLPRRAAERHGLDHEFPCRMITLDIHSSLEAVGFLAEITTRLAREGIGVNPVSGFYHDHLFVPLDRADDAMSALKDLSAEFRPEP